MDTAQAEAAKTTTAAPVGGAGTSEIDTEAVTLEQLDELMTTGKAELPVKPGGKESQEAAASTKKEDAPPQKEEPSAKKEDAPAGEQPPVSEEVVETRSQEEIDAEVEAAVQSAKDEGGDEEAQNAAAEAAKLPKAKESEPAAKKDPEPKPEEKSRRFRVKDKVTQAALELYKTFEDTDTPITLAEAERRVKGEAAPDKKESVKAAEQPNLGTIVSTLESEVADLKSKLDQAGGDEALFTKEIAQWTQQLAEKTADLKLAKRDLADEQADAVTEAQEAETARKTAVATSKAKAIELYPDAADEETPLGKALSERIVAMRDKSHPDHNVLFSGSAPEIIVKMVADELGIAPKAKPKAKEETVIPAAKKTEAPPKSKKMEPASGVKTAAGKGPKPEDAKNTVEYLKSEKASLEDLDAAFGGGDPLSLISKRSG